MHRIAFVIGVAWSAAIGATDPVRSLLEIRQEKVVVQQWDTSCGAAALATLLVYQHGLRLSEKQIAEGMLRRTSPLKVKTRGGFSLLDLKRYADSQGLQGVGYLKVELDGLIEMAPAITPVVVRGYPHFVVVRGRLGDKVLLADPAFGNRTMDVAAFQKAWQGGITFVIRRRDGQPPPNQLTERPTDTLRPSDAVVRSALR
ncbi:MAG TPA: C39 family peptidase [Burkholderiales bacterium]|nr:C39 family peptidase [Burkholderiales bacterium]